MLMPDDVDELLALGVTTDEIDELRLFYNMRIKERSLESMLGSVRQLLKDFNGPADESIELPSDCDQLQYMMNATSQDIA